MTAFLSAYEKRAVAAFAAASETALIVVTTIAFLRFISATVEGFVLGQAVGRTLSGMAYSCLLSRQRQPAVPSLVAVDQDRRSASYIAFVLPLAISAALGWGLNFGDRLIIGTLLQHQDVAYVAAAMGLVGKPYAILTSTLTAYFRPPLFNAARVGNTFALQRVLWRWSMLAFSLGGIGIVAMAIVGEHVASLLLGASYSGAVAPLLIPLAVSFTIVTLNHAIDNAVIVENAGWGLSVAQLAASLVFCIGIFLIARQSGIIGVALARLLAVSLQLALTWSWRAILARSRVFAANTFPATAAQDG
jgi:O-antigen/teichoic acid export membrane protein